MPQTWASRMIGRSARASVHAAFPKDALTITSVLPGVRGDYRETQAASRCAAAHSLARYVAPHQTRLSACRQRCEGQRTHG